MYLGEQTLISNDADRDSFLPSAVQRYHQLFMPALQLVSGMLITLGPKHTTAANHVSSHRYRLQAQLIQPLYQALQFLSSHRDTAVLLLKNEVDELSLSVMEEIRLLVSICSSVVHLVPTTELVSQSSIAMFYPTDSTPRLSSAFEFWIRYVARCHIGFGSKVPRRSILDGTGEAPDGPRVG